MDVSCDGWEGGGEGEVEGCDSKLGYTRDCDEYNIM